MEVRSEGALATTAPLKRRIERRGRLLDVTAIGVTAVIWGTTWFAITLQLGVVDPVVSLVYRFGLAAIVLFGLCRSRGERLVLSVPQHRAALGVGLLTFTIDYLLTYWAEALIVSAVVAMLFAGLAFVNLVLFRVIFGTRESRSAWVAAALGAAGVGLISWGEIVETQLEGPALAGLAMAVAAVLAAGLGNVFAHYGERAGAPLAASMAWSMGYGAVLLALLAWTTGKPWGRLTRARHTCCPFYTSRSWGRLSPSFSTSAWRDDAATARPRTSSR